MKGSSLKLRGAPGRERRLACGAHNPLWCCLVAQLLLLAAPFGHADLPARIYVSGWNGLAWYEIDGVYELTSSVGGTNDMYRRDGGLPMLWWDEEAESWAVWIVYSGPSAAQEQGDPDPTAWVRWAHLYQEDTYYPPPRAFTADLRPGVNPDPGSAETVDPINTINGNVRVSETDVAIPCPGMPLAFRRSYNSRSEAEGAMGKSWRHSYEWQIATTNEVPGLPSQGADASYRLVLTGNGETFWFQEDEGGHFLSLFRGNPYSLEQFGDGSYELHAANSLTPRKTHDGMQGLSATITPPLAVSSGAQWRVDGGSWTNSGCTVHVNAGSHEVEFSAVDGWASPPSQTVVVTNGASVHLTALHLPMEVLGTYGSGLGYFNDPWGLALDSAGFLYVADSWNHRIQRLNPTTGVWTAWGEYGTDPGEFNQPFGLAVDADDNLYVADANNNRVQRRDAVTGTWTAWGGILEGTGLGEFNGPFDVAVDASTNLYVADHYNHRVQKRSPGGSWSDFVTNGFGDGEVRSPHGLAIDCSNHVYVSDYKYPSSTCCIQKFLSDGTYVGTVGSGDADEGALDRVYGLDMSDSGTLFAADEPNDRVIKRSPSGVWAGVVGPQTLSSPRDVLAEGGRYLYIVDNQNDRVLKVDLLPPELTATGRTNLRETFGTNGLLTAISDAWGNTVTLSYTNISSTNLLTRVEHGNGSALSFEYESGRLTDVSTPSTNLACSFTYNALGCLTNAAISTSEGTYEQRYAYDWATNSPEHSLTQHVDAAGDSFSISYATNAAGERTSWGAALTLGSAYYQHLLSYDTNQCETTVSYLARGTNLIYEYSHDPILLKVREIAGPEGQTLRFSFSPQGDTVKEEVWTTTSASTAVVVRAFDSNRNVVEEGFGYDGSATCTWAYVWHPTYQLPVSVTDPEGHEVEIEYTNAAVSLIRVDDGEAEHETAFGYTTNGLLCAVTNANGHYIRYYYDQYGFPTSALPQAGPEIRFQYSQLGHLEEIAFPSSSVDTNGNPVWRNTAFDNDELGRVKKITYPDEREETFSYDAIGNLTNHTDAAGRSTRYSYLPTRKLESIERTVAGTNLTVLDFDYDQQFNTLAITDAKGRLVEAYALDLQDRPTTVTNVEGQTMSVSYGVADYVNSVTRFDGTTVSNSHDSGGRLAEVAYSDETAAFTYYKNDLLKTASNGVGIVSLTYSQANRLTQESGVVVSGTVAYTYLPAGQVSNVSSVAGTVAYSYDAAERVSGITSPEATFEYTYNTNNGLVDAVSFTNAGVTGSFTYDTTDRLTGITWKRGSQVVRSFAHSHSDADMLTSLTRETGETAYYSYDELDRLTRERHVDGESQVISDEQYTYDAAGNRLNKTHGSIGVYYSYTANGNRLTGWAVTNSSLSVVLDVMGIADEEIGAESRYGQLWVSNSVAVTPYVEDTNFWAFLLPFGMGTQEVAAAIRDAAGNTSYTTNWAVLSIVTNGSYAYNSAGCPTNITLAGADYSKTTALSWDSQYRLTSVTTNGVAAESYTYDALGRLVSIIDSTSTNFLVHDGIHVIAEVDGDGNILKSYTWGPGIDNLLAFTDHSGGETNIYFALTDRLGTVHALADESGEIVESYRFDAWGRALGVYDADGTPLEESAVGNHYLWQGRWHSWSTGLYYFRARWYEPVTGRWLSKDPVGISGGLNQYVFCGNSPVNFKDAIGLCTDESVSPTWAERLLSALLGGASIGRQQGDSILWVTGEMAGQTEILTAQDQLRMALLDTLVTGAVLGTTTQSPDPSKIQTAKHLLKARGRKPLLRRVFSGREAGARATQAVERQLGQDISKIVSPRQKGFWARLMEKILGGPTP